MNAMRKSPSFSQKAAASSQSNGAGTPRRDNAPEGPEQIVEEGGNTQEGSEQEDMRINLKRTISQLQVSESILKSSSLVLPR